MTHSKHILPSTWPGIHLSSSYKEWPEIKLWLVKYIKKRNLIYRDRAHRSRMNKCCIHIQLKNEEDMTLLVLRWGHLYIEDKYEHI